jgi:hypothetical protein
MYWDLSRVREGDKGQEVWESGMFGFEGYSGSAFKAATEDFSVYYDRWLQKLRNTAYSPVEVFKKKGSVVIHFVCFYYLLYLHVQFLKFSQDMTIFELYSSYIYFSLMLCGKSFSFFSAEYMEST